jgi:hypothetical protein
MYSGQPIQLYKLEVNGLPCWQVRLIEAFEGIICEPHCLASPARNQENPE